MLCSSVELNYQNTCRKKEPNGELSCTPFITTTPTTTPTTPTTTPTTATTNGEVMKSQNICDEPCVEQDANCRYKMYGRVYCYEPLDGENCMMNDVNCNLTTTKAPLEEDVVIESTFSIPSTATSAPTTTTTPTCPTGETFCEPQTITSTSTTPLITTTAQATADSSTLLSTGAIIGISAGGFVLLGLTVGFAWRRRSEKEGTHIIY